MEIVFTGETGNEGAKGLSLYGMVVSLRSGGFFRGNFGRLAFCGYFRGGGGHSLTGGFVSHNSRCLIPSLTERVERQENELVSSVEFREKKN